MSRSRWGTSGGFQGKNGANIGRWRAGENLVGPLPHKTTIPATQAMLDVRETFTMLTAFQRPLLPLIRVGFAGVKKKGQSAMNAAFRYNYRNALTGVQPNITMDYPEVMFSKGLLSIPNKAEVVAATAEELDFTWLGTIVNGIGAATDKANVVVYNPSKKVFIYMVNAAVRSALTYTLQLPANFSGDTVHAYMNFVSADGKMVSDSVYLSSVVVL